MGKMNKQRSVSYGEIMELENIFDEQVNEKHVVFKDPEERDEALFDFIQQYIDGDDDPQLNVR